MKHMEAYSKLAEFGRELLKRTSMEQALPMIADYAKQVIDAERCSIYIYNSKLNLVWTTLADQMEKIMLHADEGIVGHTIQTGRPHIANDPYHDEHFLATIDQKSGFKTRNIASAPIFDSNRYVIGVIQLLNKKGGDFDSDDLRFITFFAHYVSGYLELASLFSDDEAFLYKHD